MRTPESWVLGEPQEKSERLSPIPPLQPLLISGLTKEMRGCGMQSPW